MTRCPVCGETAWAVVYPYDVTVYHCAAVHVIEPRTGAVLGGPQHQASAGAPWDGLAAADPCPRGALAAFSEERER